MSEQDMPGVELTTGGEDVGPTFDSGPDEKLGVDRAKVEITEADVPYRSLPTIDGRPQMLGWYAGDDVPLLGFEKGTILLNDMCVGEPPMGLLVRILSHEYLHFVLHKEVGWEAADKLDDLVENAKFVVDREENDVVDDRKPREKWEHVVEDQQD